MYLDREDLENLPQAIHVDVLDLEDLLADLDFLVLLFPTLLTLSIGSPTREHENHAH
jgi:hypothetical protein